ncbi:Gfo/Idh/MocA family protein [Bacillus fonticola]|uniref:Gfo/Idh/MocA family protein n=1 Tax=Bacillus fonticola TaxID=2728853 RepID=UPI001473EE74|nr:Gfo/Idh/MocA family oxidoreductase [Bacillus fonticola]
MNKVRWGVLSTANIARKALIPAMMQAVNAEVVAIASSSVAKREEIAREFSIPKQYNEYEALLKDPEVDAVYIPLPNSLHKEWVMKAARAKKHVLCEKPAALTVEDFDEMVLACEQNGVLFMEAFMYQFHPQHSKVKEWIQAGEIGEVKCVNASFTFDIKGNANNIRMQKSLGGGSLWDVGSYCVHVIRNLLDSEASEIYVQGNVPAEFGVDVQALGTMKMANGVQAQFHSSFELPFHETYTVFGTEGKITVPHAFRSDRFEGGKVSVTLEKSDGETITEQLSGNQYELEVGHFSECILEGKFPSYTVENTRQNIATIRAGYESLARHAPVKLR